MKTSYVTPLAFVVDVHVEANVCSPVEGVMINDYGDAIEDIWD